MAVQIKESFKEEYFTPRSKPAFKMSSIQRLMARRWHDQFVKVLRQFPDNKFFKDIGIVLEQDRIDFEREGRIIPETTDLSFGIPVELTPKSKQRIFGKFFTQGVGGVQVTVKGKVKIFDIFKILVRQAFLKKILFADVAYVEGGRVKNPYIYLSNEKRVIYNSRFARKFTSIIPYSRSVNGGITTRRLIVPTASEISSL